MITIEEVKIFLNDMLAYVVEMEADDRNVDGTDLKTISALKLALSQHEDIKMLRTDNAQLQFALEQEISAYTKAKEEIERLRAAYRLLKDEFENVKRERDWLESWEPK